MKKLIILALSLLVATTGMAQEGKGWFITPRVGMNVATMTGTDYYGYYENAKDKIGLSMGADVEYRFSRLIGISTGLMYANIGRKEEMIYTQGGDDEDLSLTWNNSRYCLEYLQIPLLVNIHPVKGLTLKTGVQVDFLIGAHRKAHQTGWYDIADPDQTDPHFIYEWSQVPKKRIDVDENRSIGLLRYTNKTELVVPLGVSYEYRNIVLDASYHFGLSNVFSKDLSYLSWALPDGYVTKEYKERTTNRYFQVTLGYRFGL